MPNWKRNAGDRYVNVSNGPINITFAFFAFRARFAATPYKLCAGE